MKFRRALLSLELDGDARAAVAELRRVAPALTRVLVVARLPTPSFSSLFGGGSTQPQDGPMNRASGNIDTNWAAVADAAGTIYIADAHAPDFWSDEHLDYLMGRKMHTWTAIGKDDSKVVGTHQDRIALAYMDGHVGTKRIGDTLPSDWTIQDDKAADPLK